MGVKLRKHCEPPEFVIQMDDAMSFALVDLLLQALAHWADLPDVIKARLGSWARQVREIKDGCLNVVAEADDA